MKNFLFHFFIPQESNNHRAKILHHTNLFLIILLFFLASFFTRQIKDAFPSVLGVKANISVEELLSLTNKERQNAGVDALVLDEKLSEAAAKKVNDMFEYDYWAHNSPTGKTPWVFIKDSGYRYVYAGENLARGFSTTEDVIKAWMASPDHRGNMLSSNYQDVGFAVKIGKLNGEETVLIVEEFGNLNMPAVERKTGEVVATESTDIPIKVAGIVRREPLIDAASLSLNVYIITVLVFIFVLILDMIIVEKKKIMRFVGHNIDHILYLLLILALVVIWGKGVVV